MRLLKHLNENIPNQKLIYSGIEEVYKNCMPFIKDIIKGGFSYYQRNDSLLYSGRKGSSKIIRKKIRSDRQPSDMSDVLYEMWDRMFFEKFKFKARSNAVFGTGNLSAANSYGIPFIIFPVGEYKFIWSYKIRDLYTNYYSDTIEDWWTNEYLKSLNKKRKPYIKHPEDIHHAPDKWKNGYEDEIRKVVIATYSNQNIMKAIRSNHEIMLSGKEYIGLEYKMFQQSIKSYIDRYKTTKPTKKVLDEWWERWGPLNG